MGAWVFGCDICQEVCPHNQPRRRGAAPPVNPAYRSGRDSVDLLEVLGWSEDQRRAAFAGSALKRAKLAMMRRNALIAAGNALATQELPALRARVAAIAADPAEDPVVAETARRVWDRLARDD
jgi:epoxyqueuosine reductase